MAVDAGPLIALFDRDDANHSAAVSFWRTCRLNPVTNLPVITEAAFLLRFSPEARRDMLSWVHDNFAIDRDTADDLPRISAILLKYRDMRADFADASLVAMAERLGLADIASFDRDFERYRLAGRRMLRNVVAQSG